MSERIISSWIHPTLTVERLLHSASGHKIRVAILDSGIQANHPSLRNKVNLVESCIIESYRNGRVKARKVKPDKSEDCLLAGHGTGVAKIITDVARDVLLYSAQIPAHICNTDDDIKAEQLIGSLLWALQRKVQVINISCAVNSQTLRSYTSFKTDLFSLCEKAYEQNVIIVTARSNNKVILGLPAELSNVISVDADIPSNWPGRLKYHPRQMIEFAAQGENVDVLTKYGCDRRSGTSYAAPYITGMCALLLEVFPNLLSYQAKGILAHFGCTKC